MAIKEGTNRVGIRGRKKKKIFKKYHEQIYIDLNFPFFSFVKYLGNVLYQERI